MIIIKNTIGGNAISTLLKFTKDWFHKDDFDRKHNQNNPKKMRKKIKQKTHRSHGHKLDCADLYESPLWLKVLFAFCHLPLVKF